MRAFVAMVVPEPSPSDTALDLWRCRAKPYHHMQVSQKKSSRPPQVTALSQVNQRICDNPCRLMSSYSCRQTALQGQQSQMGVVGFFVWGWRDICAQRDREDALLLYKAVRNRIGARSRQANPEKFLRRPNGQRASLDFVFSTILRLRRLVEETETEHGGQHSRPRLRIRWSLAASLFC